MNTNFVSYLYVAVARTCTMSVCLPPPPFLFTEGQSIFYNSRSMAGIVTITLKKKQSPEGKAVHRLLFLMLQMSWNFEEEKKQVSSCGGF